MEITNTERRSKKKIFGGEETSSSSSKKKKKNNMLIYVAVCYTELNDDEPDKNLVCYDWYAFDPRKSPVEQFELLQPATRMMTPFIHGRAAPPVITSISVDSKVYVFKTYVVETSSPPYPITYISMFDTPFLMLLHDQVGGELFEVGGFVLPPLAGPVSTNFFPVHSGGNCFYLIWTPDEHFRNNGGSLIQCLKFRIDRVIDYRGQQVWQATIDGCDSYVINGGYIRTCVPLEGNRKWKLERCGVKISHE
ncbi:hypothetical protein FRX31_013215 [Thalictrum thalictroides]|uniref:Uncharacterized protein n=1 Tax=Thalictrum thalictroides TaxID=46969 RepID=A0A7J6WKP3_THATH|nr:hypothetical protein FRX31_013215 [Thalictrum thalictroides]